MRWCGSKRARFQGQEWRGISFLIEAKQKGTVHRSVPRVLSIICKAVVCVCVCQLDRLMEQENRRPDPLDTSDLWDAATRGPVFCAQYWYYKRPEAINEFDPRLKRFTPLHLAVQKGHMDIVHFLLEKGAHVNMMSTESSMSALQEACFLGQQGMVQMLLDYGANALHVDGNKETCLHWAARGGEMAVVDLILAKGVDYTRRNAQGRNAADVAMLLFNMKIHQRLNQLP